MRNCPECKSGKLIKNKMGALFYCEQCHAKFDLSSNQSVMLNIFTNIFITLGIVLGFFLQSWVLFFIVGLILPLLFSKAIENIAVLELIGIRAVLRKKAYNKSFKQDK